MEGLVKLIERIKGIRMLIPLAPKMTANISLNDMELHTIQKALEDMNREADLNHDRHEKIINVKDRNEVIDQCDTPFTRDQLIWLSKYFANKTAFIDLRIEGVARHE